MIFEIEKKEIDYFDSNEYDGEYRYPDCLEVYLKDRSDKKGNIL